MLIPFVGTNGQDLCLDMTVTDPPPHVLRHLDYGFFIDEARSRPRYWQMSMVMVIVSFGFQHVQN